MAWPTLYQDQLPLLYYFGAFAFEDPPTELSHQAGQRLSHQEAPRVGAHCSPNGSQRQPPGM